MKITIIGGSFRDYFDDGSTGVISIVEPCDKIAIDLAKKFVDYGKTVVLEPDLEGE